MVRPSRRIPLLSRLRAQLAVPNDAGHAPGLGPVLEQVLEAHGPLDDTEELRLVRECMRLRNRDRHDVDGLELTPAPIADELLTLVEAVAPGALRLAESIWDPCAGTGRLMRAVGPWSRAHRIGWDIEPLWLQIARHRDEAAASWRQADLLTEARPSEARNVVVLCNPPWVSGYARRARSITPGEGWVRYARTAWQPGTVHTAALAVNRIVRDLLRPGEVAGFILPDTLLNGMRLQAFRHGWAQACERIGILELDERTFAGRSVRTVLVACVRATEPLIRSGGRTELQWYQRDAHGLHEVAQRIVTADIAPGTTHWTSPGAAGSLSRRTQELTWPALGSIVTLHDGINPGSAAARLRLIRSTPDGLSRPKPVIQGRDISRGHVGKPSLWVETDPDQILDAWRRGGTSLRDPVIFRGPRLYGRQTEQGPCVAYLESEGPLALNSVHVLRWRGPGDAAWVRVHLRRLAAVLNTGFATSLYREHSGEVRGTFPQMKLRLLATMPIPWPLTAPLDALADRAASNPAALPELDAALHRWVLGSDR